MRLLLFQSLDWVDVDFDAFTLLDALHRLTCFNPSTGLMLISTRSPLFTRRSISLFQSLDWVDVDFDKFVANLNAQRINVSIPRLG